MICLFAYIANAYIEATLNENLISMRLKANHMKNFMPEVRLEGECALRRLTERERNAYNAMTTSSKELLQKE